MKLLIALFGTTFIAGCGPAEGTRYLSEPTPESQFMPHSYRQEVIICDDILAKDPANPYARANRDFFQRAIDAYESEKNEYEKWWNSLGTARRVRLNDWVRFYVLNHWDLGMPREDAIYKATQLYGQHDVPPLIPSVLDRHDRDAWETIRTTFSHQGS